MAHAPHCAKHRSGLRRMLGGPVRDDDSPDIIDMPPRGPRRRRPILWLAIVALGLFVGATTLLSYYVESVWFASLGYGDVFWTTLGFQCAVFAAFAAATLGILFGGFFALEPVQLRPGGSSPFIVVNGQRVQLPMGRVLRFLAFAGSAIVALVVAGEMASGWPTFALWWYGRPSATLLAGADHAVDPILRRPIAFYLFALPAWEAIAGWLITIAVLLLVLAVLFTAVSRRPGMIAGSRGGPGVPRGLALTWALFLVALAAQVWLGRYELLLDDHTVFAGATYTDVHVRLTAISVVAALLVVGALTAASAGVTRRSFVWLAAAAAPAAVPDLPAAALRSYVAGCIVKPNALALQR